MEYLLLLALAVIVFAGLFYLNRSGLFHIVHVSVGRPDFYELEIAYKDFKGDYSASGKPFGAIAKLCPGMTCISAYYDDPDKTPAERCRYICGVVLAEGPDETPDAEVVRKLRENNFRFAKFPRVDFAMKATFPFTTFLSPTLGAMKTYRKLAKYAKEKKLHAHPYLEICKQNTIHYMAPLSKHDEFLVGEMKE